jgi:hypothetical protein
VTVSILEELGTSCLAWIMKKELPYSSQIEVRSAIAGSLSESCDMTLFYLNKSYCKNVHPDATPLILRDFTHNWTKSFLIQQGKLRIAIGLFQTSKTFEPGGFWYWYDGIVVFGDATHPIYVGWQSGEPSNSGGVEDCGEMR